MQLEQTVVRRLAFIKYLHELGVSQSFMPEPANASSVLIFHDSIELFLQLASEILNVGKRQPNFMEYWEILSPKIPSGDLPQKESMRRLNKSRRSLKHDGTLPSQLDIDSFRAITGAFFAEAMPLIFTLEFDDLSLIDFVEAAQPRNNLKEAASLIADNDFGGSVTKAAIAFHQLIDDYEKRKRSTYGRSPFYFGPHFPLVDSFFMGLGHGSSPLLASQEFRQQLGQFIDGVKESLEAIQDAIRILAMGIDYPRYSRFRTLTPSIRGPFQGEYSVGRVAEGLDSEDAQFCIDFVIEAALKLQEFDWSISGENGEGA